MDLLVDVWGWVWVVASAHVWGMESGIESALVLEMESGVAWVVAVTEMNEYHRDQGERNNNSNESRGEEGWGGRVKLQ